MTEEEKAEDRRWGWAILIGLGALLFWGHSNAKEEQQKANRSRDAYSRPMRECLDRIGYSNLPEETLVQMCRQEITGTMPEQQCETEWDGRGNPQVCD
jgi:hypothetical protein